MAVVGATERAGALGRLPVEFLLRYGYRGRILPVNPTAETVLGLPCHRSVQAAREATVGPIDLALIMVSAAKVPGAVADCGAAGVPVAIVAASGFAETGEAGAELQAEVVRAARDGGVRVVGPNCIGTVGFGHRQVASFSPMFSAETTELVPGDIGFVSQSGALGYGVVSMALERGLGLGWAVNTGNEADVTAVEVLTALAGEPFCRGLLGYLESLSDGPALRRLAATGVPVALVKAGRSEAGQRAAASHTGALAAADEVADAVLGQLGIVRCDDVTDLLDAGEAFTSPRRPAGPRVAVVTTSGGSGIMAADAVHRYRLELADLSTDTLSALGEFVPAFGSTANPVDVTATVMSDPDLFDRAVRVIAADPAVDVLLACFCVLTGDDVTRIVTSLAHAADTTGKPVLVARTGAEHLAPTATADLRLAGIPAYPTPERAVRATAALWRVSRPRAGAGAAGAALAGPVELPGTDADEAGLKTLLGAAGLPVPAGRVVADPKDAEAAAREVGGHAVFKAVVPGLVHKTEAGGVVLDVTPRRAGKVFERLSVLGGRVLVEQMHRGGTEMLVGVAPSPLGQVLTLASGGVLTEVIDDPVFRLLPITEADAREMVAECRGAAVLRGVRGRPALDAEALVRLLVTVSAAVAGWPDGYELDLNPVAVLPEGAVILDAAYSAPKNASEGD